MDWDSHRYLECFFAVPMMGAVLHTVNVRISPEQVLYTINHASRRRDPRQRGVPAAARGASVTGSGRACKFVLIDDGAAPPQGAIEFAADYESMLARPPPGLRCFRELDEDTRATTFYTTGTTGLPKGVYYSHRQLVLHTLGVEPCARARAARDVRARATSTCRSRRCSMSTRGACRTSRRCSGVKQVYPGRYVPDVLLGLIARERVTFSHCVPTILQMMLGSPALRDVDLSAGRSSSAARRCRCRSRARRSSVASISSRGYGMSETCPILTLAHLAPAMRDWDARDAACPTGAGRGARSRSCSCASSTPT